MARRRESVRSPPRARLYTVAYAHSAADRGHVVGRRGRSGGRARSRPVAHVRNNRCGCVKALGRRVRRHRSGTRIVGRGFRRRRIADRSGSLARTRDRRSDRRVDARGAKLGDPWNDDQVPHRGARLGRQCRSRREHQAGGARDGWPAGVGAKPQPCDDARRAV